MRRLDLLVSREDESGSERASERERDKCVERSRTHFCIYGGRERSVYRRRGLIAFSRERGWRGGREKFTVSRLRAVGVAGRAPIGC